jgi:arsenate reductase
LLSQADVTMTDRDFFSEPLSQDELLGLLAGRSPREAFSFKSPSVKKLELDPDALTDAQMLDLMIKEPRLLRRPVVVIGDNVFFGPNLKTLEAAIGG